MKEISFSKVNINKKDTKLISKILLSGWLTHGKYTGKFEDNFKSYTKSKFSITVSNCTAGLHLIFLALGIKKNDEVIVPAMSHVASAHSARYTGAKVIFCDVNAEDGNINLNEIKKNITNKTKAVVVVHMAGAPVKDLVKIAKYCKRKKIYLVEDCAHALGTKINSKHVGNYGDASSFSFYPTKQITTGEGGIVITNNAKIFKKIKRLKAFGINNDINKRKIPGKYNVLDLGFNYRMTDFQAALGYLQLKRYNSNLKKRHKNAKLYENYLNDFKNIVFEKYNSNNSYFIFQIFVNKNKRDKIVMNLKKSKIGCSIHYAKPINEYQFYLNNKIKTFKNAKLYADTNISLPIHSALKKSEIKVICNKLKELTLK
tara:strand:+ start:182 stop:1297 length:1116 start_codon:yes stop_codon:yes gene_type:complete